MTDICLVLMPYTSILRPSLSLGLFKTQLKSAGLDSSLIYANLWFAEEIGLANYDRLDNSPPSVLWGEWTFSRLAFPDFRPDDSEYLEITTHKEPRWIEILEQTRAKSASFIERVAQSVLELRPRIVGCSSNFQQHCASLALLRRVRQLDPEVITLIGGANCEGPMGVATQRAFPWVDFACSGEADELMPGFCRQLLDKGRSLEAQELPYGIIGPDHPVNGQAPRAAVRDFSHTPFPDYADYFQTLGNSSIAPYIYPSLPVETSRGCWWGEIKHCTFCGFNGKGMVYRSKDPDRVIEEFKALSHQYQVRKFFVVDNILDLSYFDTVLPALENRDEPYSIFYETKANLKREQVQKLAMAGIRKIQPGIESMDDSALGLLQKGNTTVINIGLLKFAQEFGIRVIWNFLFDIPGESREWYTQALAWLPLITHLHPPASAIPIRFDRYSPYHMRPADYGLTLTPRKEYSYIYPLSLKEMEELVYYFEDTHRLASDERPVGNGDRPVAGRKSLFPEHQALRRWVVEWRKLFLSDTPPLLTLFDDNGDSGRIVDSRPCRYEAETHLEGLPYWVYKDCESATTPRALAKRLAKRCGRPVSWDELQPIVEELRERKLLLVHRQKYLSLAVRKPVSQMLPEADSPTGYPDLQRYLRDKSTQWPLVS